MLSNKKLTERIQKDFVTLCNFSDSGKKLAIVSIDMQRNFLEGIFRGLKKSDVLVSYVKGIRNLALENNVLFLEVVHAQGSESIFDSNSDTISSREPLMKVGNSAVQSTNILRYLESNNIEVVYVVGLYRTRCVLSSMIDLKERGNYKVLTSFIGTGMRAPNFINSSGEEIVDPRNEYDYYKGKKDIDVNDYSGLFTTLQASTGAKKYSLSNEVKALQNNGIEILDYYSKDEFGKLSGGLN